MSNVLSEEKKQQVLALGQLGWSLRRIERALDVRRETASGYLRAAGIPVRSRGGRPREWPPKPATTQGVSTDPVAAEPATTAEVFTDPAPAGSGSGPPGGSACEPFRGEITGKVELGRNAMAIWQDLVEEHGFSGQYASVKRFVAKLRGPASPAARVVITTASGEEAQVDYGKGPMVRDPKTGRYRRTRLFVLTLGYSRKAVRLLTWRSSTQIWAQLHERAFRRLGGATRLVVLDDLREGVLKSDVYEPTLNPVYRDLLVRIPAHAAGHQEPRVSDH
jgi:hypothetical protein